MLFPPPPTPPRIPPHNPPPVHPWLVSTFRQVHDTKVVHAYAMGVPLLAPSLRLLSSWHTKLGLVSHKGPGNVPWRRTAERKRVPHDGFARQAHDAFDAHTWWSLKPLPAVTPAGGAHARAGCAYDPNDACDVNASAAWLQFAEFYTWPHVTYFDSLPELVALAFSLVGNVTRRHEISAGMKSFFAQEQARAVGHASGALRAARRAAAVQRKEGPRGLAKAA
jgi:hypothetical protein